MRLSAADLPLSPPDWLHGEPGRLVGFAQASAHPEGGFAWLDATGNALTRRPVELWITCRMTHTFALATLRDDPRGRRLATYGVRALRGRLRDADQGGWFSAVSTQGPTTAEKRAYDHAFVVLAAASASAAGISDAGPLLTDALRVVDERFWDEQTGLVVDVWDRYWTELEPYRGLNANMHMLEAFLAASDVTGDKRYLDRALRIADFAVHRIARTHNWRLPEHFSPDWDVRLEYNRDQPDDPFRPYGVIVGHLFEWSRLLVHLGYALGTRAPDWMLPAAQELFSRGLRDGWSSDDPAGFVYTTDFDGRPVVRSRMHWVTAEAMGAAWTLHDATGETEYATRFLQWCDFAKTHHVDLVDGSWRHELDPTNQPASTVWDGKPDVYHAYQAALLPQLSPFSSFVGALIGP